MPLFMVFNRHPSFPNRYDDECDPQKHEALVDRLINQDNVHFLFGSTPVFAQSESKMANDAQRIIYHCCVGPDILYEQVCLQHLSSRHLGAGRFEGGTS